MGGCILEIGSRAKASGQLHALSIGETAPGTDCIGDRVSLRDGLDNLRRRLTEPCIQSGHLGVGGWGSLA